MEEKRTYKVKKDLVMPLRRVLARGFYKAQFHFGGDEECTCEIAVGPDIFRKLLSRAYCEEKDGEDGQIHITESEHKNTFFFNSMALIRPRMMEDGVVLLPDPEFEI